jgi:hypothetical protein
MAEFLGIYFLADIWPTFEGVESGHQHGCVLWGVFGRKWRVVYRQFVDTNLGGI